MAACWIIALSWTNLPHQWQASNEALGAGQNIPIHSYVHGDMARNEVAGS